jgi:hypothetical protein
MPLLLQHVAGKMKDDTKCHVVIDGEGVCITLFQQSIGGLLVAKSKTWKEALSAQEEWRSPNRIYTMVILSML